MRLEAGRPHRDDRSTQPEVTEAWTRVLGGEGTHRQIQGLVTEAAHLSVGRAERGMWVSYLKLLAHPSTIFLLIHFTRSL